MAYWSYHTSRISHNFQQVLISLYYYWVILYFSKTVKPCFIIPSSPLIPNNQIPINSCHTVPSLRVSCSFDSSSLLESIKMWSKLSTICMVALLLSFTLTYATARPEPTFSDATPVKINTQHVVHKFPNIIISKPTLTSSFFMNLLWGLLNFLFCFEGCWIREGYGGGPLWRSWERRVLREKNTCGSPWLHLHPEAQAMKFVLLY